MVAAAERGGRFFKVFENFVFYPPVQKAKSLLDEGCDRRALDHPDQERVRRPAPWLADPRQCPGLAA